MRRREIAYTERENALFRELTQYEKNGCQILLNGRPSAPSRVVSACLREHGSYMRDFVSDEKEHIKRINFIRVREGK